MSMLAEKKYKAPISDDPRNLRWIQDQTKFGQQMLVKMGWAPGDGLGLLKDGIRQPIKQVKVSNNEGFGYEKNSGDTTEVQQFYTRLLSSLSETNNSDMQDKKQTNKEKKRKRKKESNEVIHKKSIDNHRYGKRLRNYDTASYSSEDLTAILGGTCNEPVREQKKTRKDKSQKSSSKVVQEESKLESKHETVTKGTRIHDKSAVRDMIKDIKHVKERGEVKRKGGKVKMPKVTVSAQVNDNLILETKKSKKISITECEVASNSNIKSTNTNTDTLNNLDERVTPSVAPTEIQRENIVDTNAKRFYKSGHTEECMKRHVIMKDNNGLLCLEEIESAFIGASLGSIVGYAVKIDRIETVCQK